MANKTETKEKLVRVADVDEERASVEIRSTDTENGSRYIAFVPVLSAEGKVVDLFEEGGWLFKPEYNRAKRIAFKLFREGFANGRFAIPKGA